ncbi:MAG: exodeoxyribonuclease VII large subunit [Deltaproteobacteria bacterium]|jgi:exodeoxyribonuclease VII large subunit
MIRNFDENMPASHNGFDEMEPMRKIYTVSELNAQIKSLLEVQFPFVWIVGEISNFRTPLSGHFYFTLKDETSQISAVMFRGQQRQLKFQPEDGMRITGMGRLSVYEPRGTYQIILEYLEPSGIGALQVAFEKLKARLADEGLFDDKHKKAVPFLPHQIALITSPSGAAVHDMLNIIDRRFPNVHIQILGVKVQGEDAETEIAAALEHLNQHTDIDVAILARGGGSLEDLQAFNSESIARAIHASEIPIISGIGHETDYTIADFAADLRAPTPSAAAELAVPVKIELLQRLNDLSADLDYRMTHLIQRFRTSLADLSQRLIDPQKQIEDWLLRIDDFASRMIRNVQMHLDRKKERFLWLKDRLLINSPANQSRNLNIIVEQNIYKLIKSLNIIIDKKSADLRELSVQLQTLSPIAILKRGYSITRTIPDLNVVMDPGKVFIGQDLEVMVAKGTLSCRVKGKSENGPENI